MSKLLTKLAALQLLLLLGTVLAIEVQVSWTTAYCILFTEIISMHGQSAN